MPGASSDATVQSQPKPVGKRIRHADFASNPRDLLPEPVRSVVREVPFEHPTEAGSASPPDADTDSSAGWVSAADSIPNIQYVPNESNPFRPHVLSEVFDEWYADATDDEITLARSAAEIRAINRMENIVDQRFKAGLAETELVEGTVESDLEDRKKAEHTAGLIFSVRSAPLGDGRRLVSRTVVPWAEHPEYYALRDELTWLMGEVKRRRTVSQ